MKQLLAMLTLLMSVNAWSANLSGTISETATSKKIKLTLVSPENNAVYVAIGSSKNDLEFYIKENGTLIKVANFSEASNEHKKIIRKGSLFSRVSNDYVELNKKTEQKTAKFKTAFVIESLIVSGDIECIAKTNYVLGNTGLGLGLDNIECKNNLNVKGPSGKNEKLPVSDMITLLHLLATEQIEGSFNRM